MENNNDYAKYWYDERERCEQLSKQLDQLKAENALIESFNILQGEKIKLEQECEELKKQLMQKSEIDMFFNTPIEGWSNDPCGICRYKQTLAEIKEIAEKAEEQCAIPENYFKRNNVSWKQHQLKGLTCKFKQILQKISEVEECKP